MLRRCLPHGSSQEPAVSNEGGQLGSPGDREYVIQITEARGSRGEDENRRAAGDAETANTETAVSDEGGQLRPSGDGQSVIEVTVGLALSGGTFAAMFVVPAEVKSLGKPVLIGFYILFVADTLAFVGSLVVVAMIVASGSRKPPRVENLMRLTLWIAVLCFVFTFMAAAYFALYKFISKYN